MPATGKDRSLTWLPIVGAAVIALIGVIVIVVVGSGKDTRVGLKTDDDGALVCPDTYTLSAVTGVKSVPRAWVPLRPTGVDGGADLVPDTKPLHVTICRYPATGVSLSHSTKIRLGGSRTVKTNVAAMTKSLSKAARSSLASGTCTGPDTTYMVGFVFATGVAWVTLPGTGCQHITNGVWDTTAALRDQVVAAFDSGAWS